jgi:hypothetical protein
MWFHCRARLKDGGIFPSDVKRTEFVSKTIGTGMSLQAATSKRDSMWHSPVFTCISPNRIPVEIYNKPGMKYAVV